MLLLSKTMVLNRPIAFFYRVFGYDISNCSAIATNGTLTPLNKAIWLTREIILTPLIL
jgi:hypothetical protein